MSWATLALLALPPALIAVLQLGRLHPDEVFQVLEPAQRFAFGDGSLTWEWKEGLRNWALPGTLGLLLKACGALGIDDPQWRRAVLELPQYALHVAALAAVYRLALRRLAASAASDLIGSHLAPDLAPHAASLSSKGDDPSFVDRCRLRHHLGHDLRSNQVGRGTSELTSARGLALAAVLLVAAHAPVLHFAGRTLSESISAPLLLWGLERVELRGARARVYWLAGVLLGLAVVVRYGSLVIVLCALIVLIAERRSQALAHVVLGGALIALLLAALDWLSWGRPFHSLLEYYRYNVATGRAARTFGSEPWWFYLRWIALGVPPWCWCALLYAFTCTIVLRATRAPRPSALLLWCSAGYLLAIALTPHKEVRFLYPALLLITAASAPVWIDALAGLRALPATLALLLSLAGGLAVLGHETRFEPRGTEQFRLFVRAVRHGRGVVLLHCGGWGAPGAFYAAGRRWRLCSQPDDACTRKALRSPRYDRIVGWQDEGRRDFEHFGFRELERQGKVTLWGREP